MDGIEPIKWMFLILTLTTSEIRTGAHTFTDTQVQADSTDQTAITTDQTAIPTDHLERLTKRVDTLENLRSDDAAHLKELSQLRKNDARVITRLNHEVEELQRMRDEDLRLAAIQNQRIRELERQCDQYEEAMRGTSKEGLTPPDNEMSFYNKSNVELSSRDVTKRDNFHNDTSFMYDNLAFHAVLSSTLFNPGDNRVVIFDRLITNTGGVRYSTNTGIFTCTKPGLHIFSWSIYVSNNQYIYTDLVRNSAVLGSADTGQDTDFSMSGSATVATHLEIGDEVWVRVSAHKDGSDIYPSLSMFTGFRVH